MDVIKPYTVSGETVGYMIWCAGCKEGHVFHTASRNASGAIWRFNGDMQRPTFEPSLLIKSGHYADGRHPCWCDYRREHPEKNAPECSVCHSFVRDGQMQFLSDCTHALAGRTVPLEPLPATNYE